MSCTRLHRASQGAVNSSAKQMKPAITPALLVFMMQHSINGLRACVYMSGAVHLCMYVCVYVRGRSVPKTVIKRGNATEVWVCAAMCGFMAMPDVFGPYDKSDLC